ncbi:MAG TPA: glycosyltransferase [Steroidobacteraceae bacterium]|nr:glycosyltransferase [Steroidobacteraceae bacterium]
MGQDRNASGAVGVVVIGRNEGERLKRCLESVLGTAECIVYVDSGSSDDSVQMSRTLGVEVVDLDLHIPFTAARARNEGFRKLIETRPELSYVFFVDGDCEVVHGWLNEACRFLETHPQVAVVWGRRRERYPEKSVYNLLCDIEWDSWPVGETKACGGDAVMRIDAVRQVDGYRPDLICGEEPELCVRLRGAGWRVWRLGVDMTLHDAALYHFGQWWKRVLRGGYGYAQGSELHGGPPERHWVRESRSVWLWGLWVPLAVVALSLAVGWWGLCLLALYPLQVIRLALRGKRSARENWLRAGALVVCKFPEMLGQVKFMLDKIRRVQSGLIEYK